MAKAIDRAPAPQKHIDQAPEPQRHLTKPLNTEGTVERTADLYEDLGQLGQDEPASG